jgi:diguanylate cyclase (GGDEF)-like protein
VTPLLAALVVGIALGWALARGVTRILRSSGPGPEPGLLVSAATLDWLRRALGARAAWALVPGLGAEPPEWLAAESVGLAGGERAALEHRVRDAAQGSRDLVERFEAGTLVVRARGGAAGAVLLAERRGSDDADEALRELDVLLAALERQPRLAAVAQSEAHPGRLESLESVAHRLALELEALAPGEVIVAVSLAAGGRVVGLGGTSDARLEGASVPAESVLGGFLASADGELRTVEPPLGHRVSDRRSQSRPAILLPLDDGDTRVGAVVLRPRAGRLAPGAAGAVHDTLRRMAPRVSRALETHELRHAAQRDTLTGLGNRRRLELAMHDVAVTDGALVLLDIDHFKQLNDALGHPAGDAALVHLAGVLRREVRTGDVVARIGGEEFALWLPGTSLASAMRLAERVRLGLERSDWAWQGTPWPLRASLGVAHWSETTRHVDNLMAQADAALYAAKQAGRNRVARAGA